MDAMGRQNGSESGSTRELSALVATAPDPSSASTANNTTTTVSVNSRPTGFSEDLEAEETTMSNPNYDQPAGRVPTQWTDLPSELHNAILNRCIPTYLYIIVHTYGGDDCDLKCLIEPAAANDPIRDGGDGWSDINALRQTNSQLREAATKELHLRLHTGSRALRVSLPHNHDLAGLISLDNDKPICSTVQDAFLDHFREIQFQVPCIFSCDHLGSGGEIEDFILLQRMVFTWNKDDSGRWRFSDSHELETARYRTSRGYIDSYRLTEWNNHLQLLHHPAVLDRLQCSLDGLLVGITNSSIFGRGATRDILTMQAATLKLPKVANKLEDERTSSHETMWEMELIPGAVTIDQQSPHWAWTMD